jgi:tRNA-modifying protein YgfZ
MNENAIQTYNEVIKGCGLVDLTDTARLWATGKDRTDLIHRMSTNDLRDMALNEGRATVLTTAIGRMVDRIVVINLGERALILGGKGTAETIRRWLGGYVFYNDDVVFKNAAETLGEWQVFGPKAEAVIETLAPGASNLQLYQVLEYDDLIVGRGDTLAGSSFFVIGEPEALARAKQKALTAGAVEVDQEVYEVIRIESGLPEYGHEIGEAYIPLEAGLWSDISFSKGCYIGQEIIARMESRGKLAKTMVGVQAQTPLTLGGNVTSVAESPRFGWIGLAFVKPSEAEPGQELTIEGVNAVVAPLPFRG